MKKLPKAGDMFHKRASEIANVFFMAAAAGELFDLGQSREDRGATGQWP
jgi:hypothetical protein